MKEKMPVIDINKPCIPRLVLQAMTADQIRSMWQGWCPLTWKKEIPAELLKFVNRFDEDAGYGWQTDLMQKLCSDESVTLELMQKWIDTLPQGMIRAEIRAEMKRRKEKV